MYDFFIAACCYVGIVAALFCLCILIRDHLRVRNARIPHLVWQVQELTGERDYWREQAFYFRDRYDALQKRATAMSTVEPEQLVRRVNYSPRVDLKQPSCSVHSSANPLSQKDR